MESGEGAGGSGRSMVRVRVVDDDGPVGGPSDPLEVPLDGLWDVAGLKARLQTRCPPHPAPGSQRLVWRGRLLRDEESLARVRSETGTLHLLVCGPVSGLPSSSPKSNPVGATAAMAAAAAAAAPPTAAATAAGRAA